MKKKVLRGLSSDHFLILPSSMLSTNTATHWGTKHKPCDPVDRTQGPRSPWKTKADVQSSQETLLRRGCWGLG